MPDRHSKPCRPSRDGSARRPRPTARPRCTTSTSPSRAIPRVRTSTTVPGHALVGDHDVRAAGQHERRPVAHRGDQLVLGVGLDDALRGAAQAQRREGGEPHAPPHLIRCPPLWHPSSCSPGAPEARSWPAACWTSSGPTWSSSPTPATTSRSTARTSAPTPTSSRSGSPTRSTSAAGASTDDTFAAMDQLRALGEDVWFNLGDRDLAIGLHRAQRLAGRRAADARDRRPAARVRRARPRARAHATTPLRTCIRSGGRWHAFQEFMIRDRARARSRTSSTAARPRRADAGGRSTRSARRARSSSARRTRCSRSTRSWPSSATSCAPRTRPSSPSRRSCAARC